MKSLILFLLPFLLTGCFNSTPPVTENNEITKTEETTNTSKEKPIYGIIPTILNFTAVDSTLFQELYDTGEMTVIDVRTPEEIANGKIFDDALEINFYGPDFQDQIAKLDRNKKYLIYCRSGNRSGKTLALFDTLGFTEAYDLSGGKLAWDKNQAKTKKKEKKQNVLNENNRPTRVIDISAKMYEFSTTEIRVKKDERVLLKIENLDTTHGIRIPDLNQSGNTEILLDTSKKGSFPFTCNNLCGVGHSNMKGQIIIE